MINKKFEAYKVKREIKRSGAEYIFARQGKNEFGEPTSADEAVGSLFGLYHEQNSYIDITTGDTTQRQTKKIPMILCLYDDVVEIGLKPEDNVKINNKTFKVTGITNIQEWNIISDISLEVV